LEAVGEHLFLTVKGEKILRDKFLKSFSLAMALTVVSMIAFPAFGQIKTRTLVFSRQAKIGTQTVTQGRYTAAFDEKKDGELTLSRDGKEVLKASYKVVELDKAAGDSAVVFAASDDGSLKVRRIEIKGLKSALAFE
jgi:hypothetical protein